MDFCKCFARASSPQTFKIPRSVNATARDFQGFTKEISFASLVLSSATLDEMPQFNSGVLPPRYTASSLVQHYLEDVFVLYPFLDETRLFSSLDAVYHNQARYATSMDLWTVRFVLAIAHASLSCKLGDAQYQSAVCLASLALEQAEMVVQPGSIQGIQAILLLALYAMLDPLHFKDWYLIGAASRAMVDLGLHQDLPTNSQARYPESFLRRRIYHSIYALDRS